MSRLRPPAKTGRDIVTGVALLVGFGLAALADYAWIPGGLF